MVCGYVERGLVADEDGSQGDAQNGAEKEALGAEPAETEQMAELNLVREPGAVYRLRASRQHEQETARRQRAQ